MLFGRLRSCAIVGGTTFTGFGNTAILGGCNEIVCCDGSTGRSIADSGSNLPLIPVESVSLSRIQFSILESVMFLSFRLTPRTRLRYASERL